ncbi:MAG TPA: DapH/DapD/GlmU-related protein [Casimicrobiaceae bacterium]|nr:DapH/DapD/GlmU-related protein [Casimicrobiaceae bacterium]
MTFARRLATPTTARSVSKRLGEAALIGNPDRPIRAIGALSVLVDDALGFCDAARAAERVGHTKATVVIVPRSVAPEPRDDKTFIAVADVRAAFIDTVAWLCPDSARPADPLPGVDRGATIDEGASISPTACIGPNVVIGAGTRIGPGTVVYPDTEIGRDCVVGASASIGFVGLAYHDRADGRRSFFPHLAGVRIGDRVDIGAMTCICRGMLSHTSIGDDAKIGSLVYVSHGVVLGARAWISAGTAIAGHAAVGEDALLGIGAVVVDNVDIGAAAIVAGGSVVIRHAQAAAKLHGVPAHEVPAMRRFGPTPRE